MPKTMLTAHGGAMGTTRNSDAYFSAMKNYRMEAIEVDIRQKGDKLILAHTPFEIWKKSAKPLAEVFEYCKQQNVRVNCDVKKKGLVRPVLQIAKDLNAQDYIYFTGAVRAEEADDLDAGEAFVNADFYKRTFSPCAENLPAIKAYIESFKNPRIRGINIGYKKGYVTQAFLEQAKSLGLLLSVFTVDDPNALSKFLDYAPYNITTNIIQTALELREEKK